MKEFLYLPGLLVCDDPSKCKNLITNCDINRLMSVLFSFQSRNFIKLKINAYIKESHCCSF